MKLTAQEQAMLDGKYGIGIQLAMKVQVAVDESYSAPYMVPITRAHVALSNQEADLWFVGKFVNGGAVCRACPTVNPSFNWEQFKEFTILGAGNKEIVRRTHEAYKKIGAIMTYNCIPYLKKSVPRFGEVTTFSESSTTPFVNSVYGARGNWEATVSALCAAVTDTIPYYGYLLDESRRDQILVGVEAEMKSDFGYQLLGYCTPKKTDFKLPVFNGLENPGKETLMNLRAQLNTSGSVAMYHILSFTPEAQTMETAFQGGEPEAVAKTTQEDLDIMRSELMDPYGKVDFALFGCPRLAINQVATVAGVVQGKCLAIPLFITTSSLSYVLTRRIDYMRIIREAGGWIVSDTCMDQPRWKFLYGKKGITDSPKCAYYAHRRQMQFVMTRLENAITVALEEEIIL